jgi:deoxyuridine 5'-triphosphate nucleotidohydrolase
MHSFLVLLGYLITQVAWLKAYHWWSQRPGPKKVFDVKFVATHLRAVLPTQKLGDAAFDLSAVEDGRIEPGETVKIDTGLRLAYMTPEDEMGSGLYFQILGRSGKALSTIYPLGGVLDGMFRGSIQIIMHNGSKDPWTYSAGDKVAQMALMKIEHNNAGTEVRFTWTDKVEDTARGATGFGASGA